ncbi:uncharacterized protein [Henckelia pumila]|uniref:uncharacterized protein n=1 Tax=Henckelia pumila TaxID=405737 RepID=UPI003C6E9722
MANVTLGKKKKQIRPITNIHVADTKWTAEISSPSNQSDDGEGVHWSPKVIDIQQSTAIHVVTFDRLHYKPSLRSNSANLSAFLRRRSHSPPILEHLPSCIGSILLLYSLIYPARLQMADSDNESCGNRDGNSRNDASHRDLDRFLPIANVSRIMKTALPANAKISKDAKETVQECVSEFISFVTGEASDKCQREKRKTVNGDDLLWAMTTLGFEEYVESLKVYLQRFRDAEGEKTVAAGGRGDNKDSGAAAASSGGGYEGAYGMMGGHQGTVYGYGPGYHVGPGSSAPR